MLISRGSWWYKIPATYNETLRYYRLPDLCSLMRSLVWGWGVALVVHTLIALAALCVLTVPIVMYHNYFPEEGIMVPAFILGSIICLVGALFGSILAAEFWIKPGLSWVGNKLFPPKEWTFEEAEARYKARLLKEARKEASVIRQWYKGFKEKTCVLVQYK